MKDIWQTSGNSTTILPSSGWAETDETEFFDNNQINTINDPINIDITSKQAITSQDNKEGPCPSTF